MNNPYIETGIERLRSRWPQSHYAKDEHGAHLIVVPSVKLPSSHDASICTVLFVAPPGFPGSVPSDFFTDIDLRLMKGEPFDPWPTHTLPSFHTNAETLLRNCPQWMHCQWWKWRLQAWNPNSDTLYTYMQTIRRRLSLNPGPQAGQS